MQLWLPNASQTAPLPPYHSEYFRFPVCCERLGEVLRLSVGWSSLSCLRVLVTLPVLALLLGDMLFLWLRVILLVFVTANTSSTAAPFVTAINFSFVAALSVAAFSLHSKAGSSMSPDRRG